MSNQAEHDRRVDYVEFPSSDLDETKTFYSGVFGWQFTDYGPDYCAFADGRLNGGFHTHGQPAPGGGLVVMYALDLEAIEKSIRDHGGTIVKPIFSFPGGRRFHFRDPSGNELAVWSDQGL